MQIATGALILSPSFTTDNFAPLIFSTYFWISWAAFWACSSLVATIAALGAPFSTITEPAKRFPAVSPTQAAKRNRSFAFIRLNYVSASKETREHGFQPVTSDH